MSMPRQDSLKPAPARNRGGRADLAAKLRAAEARIDKLEAELNEQTQLTSTVLQTIPGWMMLLSHEGVLLNMFGQHLESGEFPCTLVEHKVADAMGPRSGRRLMKAIDRALRTGKAHCIELEFPTASGNRIFQTDLLKVDGSTVAAFMSDITERKRAEEELHNSEKQFRGLAEGSVQGIVVHRFGKLLFANQAYAEIYGYGDPDQVLALGSIERLNAPEERAWLRERGDARLRGEDVPSFYESKGLREDGSVVHVSCLNSLIEWEGSPAILTTLQDITKRKLAEQQLRANERLMQIVFDHVPTAIGVKDRDQRYLFANKAFGELFKVDTEGIKGKTFAELDSGYPEQVKRVMEEDAHLLETGEPLELAETPVRSANGEQGWRHVIKIPIQDDSGENIGLLSAIEDITQRKRAEDALRENGERMRSVLDSAADGIFIADRTGNIETINPAGARMFGYAVEEVAGQSVAMLIPPDSRKKRPGGLEYLREGRGDGSDNTLEVNGIRKDGSRIALEISLGEFVMGRQRKFTGFVRDITQRKLAEEKIRKSERQLRHAQEIAHLGYWERDFRSDVITWSAETFRIFGLDPEAYHPDIQSFVKLVHPEDRQRLVDSIEKVMSPEQSYRSDYRIIRPDGTIRHVETRGELICDEGGVRQKLVGALLDITEKKKAEEELKSSQLLLDKIINVIPSSIYMKDLQGRYLMVNEYMATLYDLRKEDFIGKHVSDLQFLDKETIDVFQSSDREVFEKGKRIEIPRIKMKWKGSEVRWHRITKVPMHNEEGEITGLVGIVIDISDHVLAEKFIAESADKYHSLFELANDSIFILEPSTLQVLDANNNAVKHLGYTKEELLQMRAVDFTTRESFEKIKHKVEQLRTRGSAVFETVQIHKTGRKIPVEISSNQIEIGGKKVLQSFVRDLSFREHYEEALRINEEKMRHLVESTNAVVWEIDTKSFQFTYVSPQSSRITGYEPEEWRDFDFWADMVHPLDREDAVQLCMGSLERREDHSFEYRIIKKSGETVWVKDIVSVIAGDGDDHFMRGVIIDITEQKLAEEKLNNVIESSPIILWAIDSNGTITLTRGKGLANQGFNPDQLIGQSIFQVYRDYPDFLTNIRRALEGEAFTAENETYGRTFMRSFRPLFDTFGQVTGVIGVSTDVTERTKAEEELRESEMRYRTVVEAMTEGVVAQEAGGAITTCNTSAERILGLSVEQMVGRRSIDPRWRAIHSDGSEFPGESHPAMLSLRTGKPVSDMVMGVHKPDGELVWILINAVPIFQENKEQPSSVVTTFTDITDKKQAEEERLRLITAVEQTAEGVIITDAAGTIQYANAAFERITGYSRDEAIGKNPRFLKSGKQDLAFYESMWDAISHGKTWRGDLVNRKKDGSLYEEEMNISPIRDAAGSIVNFIAVKQDITERKQSEERIKLQEQQLIQADKMASLGILVSGVAHEINNPNSFITFNTPILERIWSEALPILKHHQDDMGDFTLASLPFEQAAEVVPKLLNGIAKGATRIKKIVGTLKEFAGRDLGGEFKPIDLNAVLDSAVNLLSNEINRRTNHFSVEFGEGLPKFQGDFQKIEQVIINLITNACQALPDRDRSIQASTDFDAEKGMVRMTLTDEGTGIAKDNLSKIMDPFFTTKRDAGGTGLGLSVSYSIIEEHHGSMEFFSVEGEGTTVVICLPAII